MSETEKSGGFKTSTFEELFESEKSFWFTARKRLIIYFLKKYFPDMKDYIEIGCGTGFLLQAVYDNFPNCKITASDLFLEALDYAKKRVHGVNFIQLDSTKMTEKEQYDGFGAFDVLEHINEDELVMKNLYNSLKNSTSEICSGGVITVPQHMFMWSVADEENCHVRRYSQKELRRKLEKAGFKVERMTGFVSLLFPCMIISRFFLGTKRKKESEKLDFPVWMKGNGELNLPAWMNAIFSFVMYLEFILLRLGVKFPFGGSIIAVVKK